MLSRRSLLTSALSLAIAGCKRAAALPAACTDIHGLSTDAVATRTSLRYVDRAPAEDKRCAGCTQYKAPPSDGACGGCKLLEGPIHPNGTCSAFVPKA